MSINRVTSGGGKPMLTDEAFEIYRECSEHGWDGYDASPLSEDSVLHARNFIDLIPVWALRPDWSHLLTAGSPGTYGATVIFRACRRIALASCHACIRKSISILKLNAFSICKAISGESVAFSFSKSERVARRTPNTLAASVTLKPSSSIISVLINVPGWDGFMPILMGVFFISDRPPNPVSLSIHSWCHCKVEGHAGSSTALINSQMSRRLRYAPL